MRDICCVVLVTVLKYPKCLNFQLKWYNKGLQNNHYCQLRNQNSLKVNKNFKFLCFSKFLSEIKIYEENKLLHSWYFNLIFFSIQKCGDPSVNHECFDCLHKKCYRFYESGDCAGLKECLSGAEC